MKRRHLLSAAAALAFSVAHPAHAQTAGTVDLAGVKYAPSASVGGSNLVLNGAGIRYKFVIKVYTAGLYLGSKVSTPEAVLSATGPKRIHVVMLRDIDGNELGKLFTRGMQDNADKSEFSKSIAGTLKMAELFSAKKKLAAGESFTVDFVPNQGTTVAINGKVQGDAIKEPEFFSALLRIWLGPNPADRLLKDALLGHQPNPN